MLQKRISKWLNKIDNAKITCFSCANTTQPETFLFCIHSKLKDGTERSWRKNRRNKRKKNEKFPFNPLIVFFSCHRIIMLFPPQCKALCKIVRFVHFGLPFWIQSSNKFTEENRLLSLLVDVSLASSFGECETIQWWASEKLRRKILAQATKCEDT